MKYLPALMLTLLVVTGCDHKTPQVREAGAAPVAFLQSDSARRRDNSLAYEHTVSIELERDVLPRRMKEIQAACVADKTYGCALLDVDLRSASEIPSGTIRMRLAPAGINVFTATASKDGAIKEEIVHAQDLAEQVTDTERELALLTTHRDRMAEFARDKSLKVEQLITVSKELASVQTQLDAAATTRANLHRRIDTELLTLNLNVTMKSIDAQHRPIRDALHSFVGDFADAIAQVIRFVAALIPWLVVIVPGIFFLRMFWQAVGRRLARRAGG